MEGFLDTAPLLVKVTWAEGEVPLLNGEALPYGLRAQTTLSADGGITRWFVPWEKIDYIKQDIPAPPPVTDPVKPEKPEKPDDSGGNDKKASA